MSYKCDDYIAGDPTFLDNLAVAGRVSYKDDVTLVISRLPTASPMVLHGLRSGKQPKCVESQITIDLLKAAPESAKRFAVRLLLTLLLAWSIAFIPLQSIRVATWGVILTALSLLLESGVVTALYCWRRGRLLHIVRQLVIVAIPLYGISSVAGSPFVPWGWAVLSVAVVVSRNVYFWSRGYSVGSLKLPTQVPDGWNAHYRYPSRE